METKSKSIKLVVITTPEFFPGEAELVNTLFEHGLELLHVRKPSATKLCIFDPDFKINTFV